MTRRVLVVEDDALTREVVGTVLDLEEFEVVVVDDAEEALETLADDADFDLVVADVMMPGMDGFELCRRIKSGEAPVTLPVVLLTAKGDDKDRARGREVGADAYMTKPFSPLELIETIRSIQDAGETG